MEGNDPMNTHPRYSGRIASSWIILATVALLMGFTGRAHPIQTQSLEANPTSKQPVQPVPMSRSESKVHRDQLISEHIKPDPVHHPSRSGYIQTNTVALQEYALYEMLKLANELNTKWALGIPSPITSDLVTTLRVAPHTNYLNKSIVILGRYHLFETEGALEGFRDKDYYMNAYEGKLELFRARAKEKDRLNRDKVIPMARQALHSLGWTEELLKVPKQPSRYRQSEGPTDALGKRAKFPHYEVEFETMNRHKQDKRSIIRMEISGITGTIANFWISSNVIPRNPLPTNYWQLLGIRPPNQATNAVPANPPQR